MKELKETLKKNFLQHLTHTLAKRVEKASNFDRYQALALTIRDLMVERWLETKNTFDTEMPKHVNYISLEFLMGRTIGNAMINLGVLDVATEAMKDLGYDIDLLRDEEVDAGLGNGGLGRLAACFLDSMATLDIPNYGYGIRYDFGIFKQQIIDDCQVEEPDNWLSRGNPWEIRRPEKARIIRFGGRTIPYTNGKNENKDRKVLVDAQEVLAMPFDTPIPGYRNNMVNTLRLWSAKAISGFNLSKFNDGDYINANLEASLSENITRVLYPNDNNHEGKELRLKQQYFLVSATLQDIIARLKTNGKDVRDLPQYNVIQLNDTHPALAIPELMRILVDEEGLLWEEAWDITTRTFNYTNHTLMSEALETWPVAILEKLLPRQLEIIYEINFRFLRGVSTRYVGDNDRLSRMSIIAEHPYKMARMAYMCVVASGHVNGVAALHTELLKNGLFRDFNDYFPGKFVNVTNGITPRRWLKKANRPLAALLDKTIGKSWPNHLEELKRFEQFASDRSVLQEVASVKRQNKEVLAGVIKDLCGVAVSPDAMFDVQVKRLHEYKRQFLNILHAIALYLQIKDNPNGEFVPRVILFGAKSAPGYYMAKLIIRLINAVGEVINSDPAIGDKLKVLFLPNYRVSLAEKIIPAADLSEQISLAGTEASGTSNMKFALNGALTIGTLDGANVEICEQVGRENIFIFGLTVREVAELRANGYNPADYINRSIYLQRALELIRNDFFSPAHRGVFQPLLNSLGCDYYMVAADFDSYMQTQAEVAKLFTQPELWHEKCIRNIANMGTFSSDRSIEDYCQKIWNVSPCPVNVAKDLPGFTYIPGKGASK